MNRCSQRLPCLVHSFLISGSRQNALSHAPCHAVEEETCTRHFRAAIVGGANEAYIPVSILALAFQQSFAHVDEVFLQILVVLVVGRQCFHHANQGCVNPAIATAPVTVAAVFLLVGRNVVLVSPPQTFLLVEQSACQCVACPLVGVHGIVEILFLAADFCIFCIYRHSHLYGVDPCPVRNTVGCHLMVEVCLHMT